MNCHDSDGASAIAVNNTNDGVLLNDTTTARTGTTTVNLRPFNTSDTLLNARDQTRGQVTTLGTFRTNFGRVLNVKDQFNSTNQTGKAWASHHNLNQFTKRYTTRNTTYMPNGAFTTYVTKEGQNLQTAGEMAGLHCSDCHLNETNAHGAVNAWYMNQSKTTTAELAGSESDTAPTTTGRSNTTQQIMCLKCHNQITYASNGGSASNSRYDHSTANDCAGSNVDGSRSEYVFGIVCLVCHGGFGDTAQTASGGLGAIHGNNEDYFPGNGATSSKRYRFMAGGTMRFFVPGGTTYSGETQWNNTTNSRCYTISSTQRDTWSGTCNSHSSGVSAGTTTRARPLEY